MRAIAIKTPPSKNHRSASAPKPSASRTTPRTTKSAPAAESPSLLARIVEALLHFISAHRIERIGSVTRNRHRFRGAIRCNSRNRHTGWHNVAHGTTGSVLSGTTLQHGEILKTTSARIRLPRLVVRLACPRQKNQFKVRLHVVVDCVQHHFLRARGKRRHLHQYGVVPIGWNEQPVTAIHIRPRIDLFLRSGIGRRNCRARNRHVARLHHAVNGSSSSRGSSRLSRSLPRQQMRMKHDDMKQEDKLKAQSSARSPPLMPKN